MCATTTLIRVERPVTHRPILLEGWPRRAGGVVIALIGATFVAVTLAANLFHVGPAFERLTDGFRPVITTQAIAADRQDIARLSAAGTEFQTTLAPALAQQLKLTPAQMTAMVDTQYPAVAAGLKAIPTIVPTFGGLVTTLDQQRPLFRSADAIPTKNLPATTVPWGLFVVGIVTIGLGAYTWFSPNAGVLIAIVLGALLVAVPLLLSLPQKASDADSMNTHLKPVYTQALITQSNGALSTLSAMGTEMQTKMLPAIATQLKMSPAQMQAFLAQGFPATAAALNDLPASLARFHGLVSTFDTHLSDYKTLKPVELVPIVQVLIAGGIALILVGAAGIVIARVRS